MNIFESIEGVTRRIEPFHSQFLADALKASINGDRTLFNGVWRLTAANGWDVPANPGITAEEVVPGQGRIDIAIKSDSPQPRIVGIEVKTTDSSATPGQLERYRGGLAEKFPGYAVTIAYLTPFNQVWAPDKADALPTVKEFTDFQANYPDARHISWLDIAAIPWHGNELWRQHQLYVYQHISSHKKLRISTTRDRSLDQFFGEESVTAFWEALSELGIESSAGGAVIELAQLDVAPDFANKLAQAFQILITDGDKVSRNANRADRFSADLRRPFLDSPRGKVHEALFALSNHNHVWVQGEGDYGIRVAHTEHTSGVSLVRSRGPERLEIVGQR